MSSPTSGHLAFLSAPALSTEQWAAEILSSLTVFDQEWHRWMDHCGGVVRVVGGRVGVRESEIHSLNAKLWPVMDRLVAHGLVERHAGGTTFRLTVRGRSVLGLPAHRVTDARDADLVTVRGCAL